MMPASNGLPLSTRIYEVELDEAERMRQLKEILRDIHERDAQEGFKSEWMGPMCQEWACLWRDWAHNHIPRRSAAS